MNHSTRTTRELLTVLIDLDGVAAVWLPPFEAALLDLDPDTTVIDATAYDVFDRFSTSRDNIKTALNLPGFYRELLPMPGVETAIAQMQDEGIEVYFASVPTRTNPTCASDKLDWVANFFGGHMADRTILGVDKTAVRGDILIDDRPSIDGAFEPSWQHVVFDADYNKHIADKPRLTSWSNWRDVVEGVAL